MKSIDFDSEECLQMKQMESISQSRQIISIRSGAFDPLQQKPKDLTTLGGSKKSDSGGEAPKPKKDVSPDNLSLGKKEITYKPSPGSGNGGSGNYNINLPKDVDPDKSISDPDFWNTLESLGDSEDESEPTEAPKPSKPTGMLTKEIMPQYDSTTKPISPFTFRDWEGENKVIKSKELKKTLYAYGYETGVASSEDLVPCPIQENPDLFQRENCAKITSEGLEKMRNKIINLATSTNSGMVKIELPMPYFDTELAVGYLNMITGDCFFFP